MLVVYKNESTLPAAMEIAKGLREGLDARLPGRFELYSEYLDTVRFPAPDHLSRLGVDLAAKYADVHLDIVMAVGPGALQFILDNRSWIALGVPLIFGGIDDDNELVKGKMLPADVKGVVSSFDVPKTIDLARRLQPDAKRAVVMSGSADFDRRWEKRARETLKDYHDIDVQYVSGLTLEGFKQKAKQLPSDVILVILTVFQDAEGQKVCTPRGGHGDRGGMLRAPAYGVYGSYIGAGVLGGYVETFESMGRNMVTLTDQYLAGANPTPQIIRSKAAPLVDWRQMKRWGIPAARLRKTQSCDFTSRRPGKNIAG